MDSINGLKEYVRLPFYREALGLPEEVTERYEMLAQGEYNRNYVFTHPVTGKKLVLRVNCGSQMHLRHQIEYEFHALKLLESSGRTPKPLYVDGSLEYLEHGIMVMEFLPGTTLDYHKGLGGAAECLADIHSVKMPEEGMHTLITPKNPLEAILDECEEMVKTYMESSLGEEEKKEKIREMLDTGWEIVRSIPNESVYQCCVNTELNNTNFLVDENGYTYLVDWEKPLYADPAQDLGHFLAPTTTFWKTDVLLEREEMLDFLDTYIRAVAGRFDVTGLKKRAMQFTGITCLRGITWCAMAWVQYRVPGKMLFNQSTFEKLNAYLDADFLEKMHQFLKDTFCM